MRLANLLSASLASIAVAQNEYMPPKAGEIRSSCPGLNALANHGFLPRSGKDITLQQMLKATADGANVAEDLTMVSWNKAMEGPRTTGKDDTLNLDDLGARGQNISNHDASLSRADCAVGDCLNFNPAIWAATNAHFTGKTIGIAELAKARVDRIAAAKASNPHFYLPAGSDLDKGTFLVLAGFCLWGHCSDNIDARTDWVNILFKEERFPYAEGWTRPSSPITLASQVDLMKKIADATPKAE